MIEFTAVTLHALTTMPRPMTCPRVAVWMRRHSHSMQEAAMPDLAEALIDMINSVTPGSLTLFAVAIVLVAKYLHIQTARRPSNPDTSSCEQE